MTDKKRAHVKVVPLFAVDCEECNVGCLDGKYHHTKEEAMEARRVHIADHARED